MDSLSSHTRRTLWRNSVSQVVGRLALSFSRFLAAALVVRYAGSQRFGEYALILNFLFLFEFLAEFGQVDIGVRNICRTPDHEGMILRALSRLEAMQGLLLAVLLPPVIYLLDYPAPLVRAAAIGSVGVVCYSGLQVFRASFKVHMTMERDVMAELAGTAVMLPLTWYACTRGASLEALIACYSVSRVAFLGAMLWLGRHQLPMLRGRAQPGDVVRLLRQAAPLGLAGLLVAVYDGLPPVMLSKMTDMNAVAQLAGACRYFFPVIVVVQAITTVFYPMLSSHWSRSSASLTQIQQIALEAALLIGSGLACVIFASAGFLMRLIGPALQDAAGLLQLMACVLVLRTLTAAMSPLIVVAGRQTTTMWLALASIALQAIALMVLIPRFGAIGVAIGYLLIELVAGVVPVSVIGQRTSGVKMKWGTPVKIVACAAIAAAATEFLPFTGTIWSGMVGGLLYLGLTLTTGALSPRRLHRMSVQMPEPLAASAVAREPTQAALRTSVPR